MGCLPMKIKRLWSHKDNAPINVMPAGGGGGGEAGHRVGIDFFQKFSIKFPAHGQIIPVKCNQISPPQAAHCCPSQGRT